MNELPTIKAVAFDLDGLMFNTEEIFNLTGRELVRRRGKEMTPEVLSRMMGRRPNEAFAIMIEMLELSDTMDVLRAESDTIFREIFDVRLAPMPGLHELLEHIEVHQLPKGVATSSPRLYLDGILERFALTERFLMTLTAEDVTHGKPHPEIYLTAAQKLGVQPHEMMVLEDSEAGTMAAAAAGAYVVSVPHEYSRSHDFARASYIATCLNDPHVMQLITGGRIVT